AGGHGGVRVGGVCESADRRHRAAGARPPAARRVERMTAASVRRRPRGAGGVRPSALVAAAWLAVVVLAGLLAPLSTYDVIMDVDPSRAHEGPAAAHWLGTDHLGRDVLMRLVFACQFFVGPGLLACGVALVLAVPAGAVAGFRGGLVE